MLVLQIHAKTHSELSMLPRVQRPCLCPPSMLNRVLHKSVRCLVRSDMPLQNGSSAETCRRCISGGVSEECVACLERLQQAAGNVWQHDHQLKVDNTAAHFWIHLKARCTPEDGEQCFWKVLSLQQPWHPLGTLLACPSHFLQGHQSLWLWP